MADGYAQATRNAALVNLHSAAGVGHAMGNIFTAYRNRTPLVITAGQQARSILPYEPFLFATQATKLPEPYVKWSTEPARGEDVPGAIARAYHIAMQAPCGPTFVSIPVDDWDRTSEAIGKRTVSRTSHPDPDLDRDDRRDARSQHASPRSSSDLASIATTRGIRSSSSPSGIRRSCGSARCRRAAAFPSAIRCLPDSCRRSASRSSRASTVTI